MKDCLQSTQQEVFKYFHNFGIILGFKALRLCSLMIAYATAVNQSKALLQGPTFPLPAQVPHPQLHHCSCGCRGSHSCLPGHQELIVVFQG